MVEEPGWAEWVVEEPGTSSEITGLSWAFEDHEPAGRAQVLFIVVVRRCGKRRDLPPSLFCYRRLAGCVRGCALRPWQLPEAVRNFWKPLN